jgi:formylmethanofuran dehydrogenase subunit E
MLSPKEFNEWTEKAFAFHTKRAPGIVIGVAMVDIAKERLGEVQTRLNAIAETQACIVDVIQVMLGCTFGNKYLRVVKELGHYAVTLFDRFDGRGVRVFVDVNKIDPQKTPELARFFKRTRDPEVKKGGEARIKSGQKIIEEFHSINKDIFGVEDVRVLDHGKPPMLRAGVCDSCGESFLVADGETTCKSCIGKLKYYEVIQ